jgi:hypothetical protein
VAQDGARLRALVAAVMNFKVTQKLGNFLKN